VKAVANGNAVITVKSADGKYVDTVNVTVDIPEPSKEEAGEETGENAGEESGEKADGEKAGSRRRGSLKAANYRSPIGK
jgi:hypothetical protein